ncbi:MAG: NAD(P)-dependent oxidoreductase, partial [Alphaproteobacteria bacterium]|nr:NAD(P)-dependent oxidoreductase [Alphaproteobacteria bacterium]
MTENLGFVGTGKMGAPMAARLIDAGHALERKHFVVDGGDGGHGHRELVVQQGPSRFRGDVAPGFGAEHTGVLRAYRQLKRACSDAPDSPDFYRLDKRRKQIEENSL